MKNGLLFLLVISFVMLACLNPPHDNEYDPDNPNKAYLGGKTYRLDDTPLPQAQIRLMHESEVVDSTKSDVQGRFEFVNVDPGIYKVSAEAKYYKMVEFSPESLPAGAKDTFDIYFNEMFFNFEGEPIGAVNIPWWTLKAGDWQVVEDQSDPIFHTVPNVYQGDTAPGGNIAYCLTDQEFNNFFYSVAMKSEDISSMGWQMGIYFRYVDDNNYYRFRLTDHAATIVVNKVVDGNATVLFTDSSLVNKNTWYRLSVTCMGSEITCRLLGGGLNITKVITDDQFYRGKLGILTINQALIHFDDIVIRTIK